MKKYKNRVKLIIVCNLITFSFLMQGSLNSSLRRTAGSALQSGLRYYPVARGGSVGAPASNISVSGSYAMQNFKPMAYQPNSFVPKNIAPTALPYALPEGAYNTNSGSQASSDDPFSSAKFFLALLASLGLTSQRSYADEEKERAINVGELLNKRKVDAALYPELTKFIKKYSCAQDIDARAQRVLWSKNYMNNVGDDSHDQSFSKNLGSNLNDVDARRLSEIRKREKKSEQQQILDLNPILKQGGFFNAQSLGGKGGFIPTSGTLFNDVSSDFFIKGSSIDRIINAERMNKYLKDNKLHGFKVATECLTCKDGSINVVSEKIKIGDQDKKMSLQEVQNLVKISEDTGYWDWQFGRNVMRDVEGRLVFVDTEDISYNPVGLFDNMKFIGITEQDLFFLKGNKGIRIAFMLTLIDNMEQEAGIWFIKKLMHYSFEHIKNQLLASFGNELQIVLNQDQQELVLNEQQQKESMKLIVDFVERFNAWEGVVIPLSEKSQYDTDIDFEQVKREFKDFQNSQSTIEEID